MSRVRGLPLALLVVAVTVAADRATKVWAERALVAGPCVPGDGCIELVGSLRLHLVYNHGAAFSTGTSLGPLFGLVAAVMTVVLLRLAATAPDRLRTVLFGLIAGGAVGNLVDRVIRAENGLLSGGVIDFVDVQWWPVFNVADMAVVLGVVAFVALSLLQPDGGSAGPDPAGEGDAADEGAAASLDAADDPDASDGDDAADDADAADGAEDLDPAGAVTGDDHGDPDRADRRQVSGSGG